MTTDEAARARRLILQFGLTPAEYDQVLAYQGGVCALCGRPPVNQRLGTDHDHKTGETRGFVCWGCNKALAYLHDSSELARKVVEYLERPPVFQALGRRVFGRPGRVSRKMKAKEKLELLARHADTLKSLGLGYREPKKPKRSRRP